VFIKIHSRAFFVQEEDPDVLIRPLLGLGSDVPGQNATGLVFAEYCTCIVIYGI